MIVQRFQIFVENDFHLMPSSVDGIFQCIQRHGLITVDGSRPGKYDPDPEFPLPATDRIAMIPGAGENSLAGSRIDQWMIVDHTRNRSLRTAAEMCDIGGCKFLFHTGKI